MAVIGSATLNIVPKVQGGLANAINKEISKANIEGKGKAAGGGFMGGFASGASIGLWSTIASKAIGAVTSSLGAAAGRVDTLNNYPRIMQSLGVETDVANRSIQTMSDALQNVPTRLDDMASTVQGLYAATSKYGISLDTVTDAGLALNSMLLAGGQSQTIVNSAMEQFRQMVSKGKPELQDWKSLIQAAPGQLNELAKEMLGATATADDLYAALGGGKESDYGGPFEWGSISMGEFVTRFAQLKDKFASDAEDAQGGIQTAFANMQNAVTKGVAGVMDAFGQGRIASAIGDVKVGITAAFKEITSAMPDVVPIVDGAWQSIKAGAAEVGPVVGSVFREAVSVAKSAAPHLAGAFSAVVEGVKGLGPIAKSAIDVVGGLIPIASKVVQGIAPMIPAIAGVKLGIGAASGAMGLFQSAAGAAQGVMQGANGVAGLLNTGLGKMSKGLLGAAEAAGNTGLSGKLLSAAAGVEGLAGAITGPMVLGVGAAVGGIALLIKRQEGLRQAAENGRGAISGFADAVARSEALDDYGNKLTDIGTVAKDTTDYLADMTGRWQRHADVITANNKTAEETIGTWNTVRDILLESVGATDLSAEARGRLEWAVRQYNEATGESITIEDAIAGKYQDQQGQVQDLTEKVKELAQARIDAARQQANEENLKEAFKAQADAQKEVADAQQRFNEVYDGYLSRAKEGKYDLQGLTAEQFAYQAALSDSDSITVDVNGEQMKLNDALSQAEQHLKQSGEAVEQYSKALGESAPEAEAAADAYSRVTASGTLLDTVFQRQGVSASDFAARLRELGGDVDGNAEKINNLSSFELTQLASSFDGTAASVISSLESMGIDMAFDEAAVSAAKARKGSDELGEALGELGVSAENASEMTGASMDVLTSKLYEAGVSSDDLRAIGTENFAALAEQCGGNVDQMVGAIANFNDTPLQDKQNTVTTEKASLIDAEGHVYYWNGMALVDKFNNVVTDKVSLVDAEGHVLYWNGMTLQSKSSTATVSGNAVNGAAPRGLNDTKAATDRMYSKSVSVNANGNVPSGAAGGNIWDVVRATNSLFSKTVDIITNHVTRNITENAAGGFRLHADGGVRYHAPGAIVNAPGLGYPLDLVGEAGAEAIVPLTNRKYAQPFVDLLVDGVVGALGGSKDGRSADGPTQIFNITTDNPELAAQVVANRQRQAYR